MNSDPFREMASAMRSRQGFSGATVKFSKEGNWASKDTDLNDAELLALVSDTMRGFVLWLDGKPADYHMGFVRDRFQPPQREQLGHEDKYRWKNQTDPWQFTIAVPLLDLNDNNALFMFTTSSQGGKGCIANLLDAFSNNLEMHPEDASKLPIVTLGRDSYKHQSYGKVFVPVFDIIKWVEPPRDLRPIVPPAPSSGLLFDRDDRPLIEHDKPIDRKDALIGHDSRPPEIDDDIPF
jgi:hypothetical protein